MIISKHGPCGDSHPKCVCVFLFVNTVFFGASFLPPIVLDLQLLHKQVSAPISLCFEPLKPGRDLLPESQNEARNK